MTMGPAIVRILREEERQGLLHSEAKDYDQATDVIVTTIEKRSDKKVHDENLKKGTYEYKERYQTLVEDISDWIWEIDRNGKFTYSNPKVKDLLGYMPHEVIGKTLFDFTPEGETERIRATFRACVELKNPIIRLENFNLHKDGRTVVFETSGVPIFDAKGNLWGYRGVTRDVTERKKMEEELRRKNIQLEEINKALEDYTYVISHDLKEPLRSLRIFSSFLLEEPGSNLSEREKDCLERIQKAAVRMGNLVDDLLKLSRIGRQDIEFKETDITELLREGMKELTGIISEKKGEVKFGSFPVIISNSVLIGELFKNLISNGIKFNDGEKPIVEITCDERENEYLFCVKDNGIGIDSKYLDTIFVIFKQLNPREKYGGTGAGLTICKKIVEKHGGGRIWAESSGEGKGSVFYFIIPKKRAT
ncbi:MAG: PAS domain S-box protein [Methanobacteriota archaeon]